MPEQQEVKAEDEVGVPNMRRQTRTVRAKCPSHEAALEGFRAASTRTARHVEQLQPELLTARQCMTAIETATQLVRVLEGLQLTLMAVIRARDDARTLGRRPLTDLLTNEAGMDLTGLRSRMRQADVLNRHPSARVALADGRLTADQASAIAQAASSAAALGRSGDDEVATMLKWTGAGPRGTALMKAHADQLRQEAAAARQSSRPGDPGSVPPQDGSYLRWSTQDDGTLRLQARLDPARSSSFVKPIEREVARLCGLEASASDDLPDNRKGEAGEVGLPKDRQRDDAQPATESASALGSPCDAAPLVDPDEPANSPPSLSRKMRERKQMDALIHLIEAGSGLDQPEGRGSGNTDEQDTADPTVRRRPQSHRTKRGKRRSGRERRAYSDPQKKPASREAAKERGVANKRG